MPKEKVEGYKLSKAQMGFSKTFKKVLKVQKGLMANLKVHLTAAGILREQLGEVEGTLEDIARKAPTPDLLELEGQEEVVE